MNKTYEKIKKFLPIGTVVKTNIVDKKIMVTGFCVALKENNKVFDYLGCLYPEGMIYPDKTFVFNHNDIEEILFFGYLDEEEKKFKNNLNANLENFTNTND